RRPRHHARPGRPAARLRRAAADEDLRRVPALLPGHRVASRSTPSPALAGGPGGYVAHPPAYAARGSLNVATCSPSASRVTTSPPPAVNSRIRERTALNPMP